MWLGWARPGDPGEQALTANPNSKANGSWDEQLNARPSTFSKEVLESASCNRWLGCGAEGHIGPHRAPWPMVPWRLYKAPGAVWRPMGPMAPKIARLGTLLPTYSLSFSRSRLSTKVALGPPHRVDSSPKALGELITLPAVWGQFSEVSGRTVAPWWLNWPIHGLMEHKGSPRLHTGATVLPKPWENCSLCPPSGDSSPRFLGELSPHGG